MREGDRVVVYATFSRELHDHEHIGARGRLVAVKLDGARNENYALKTAVHPAADQSDGSAGNLEARRQAFRDAEAFVRMAIVGGHDPVGAVLAAAQIAPGPPLLPEVAERTISDVPKAAPIPMRLVCPRCGELHVDEGEFATKPHHTHACQECGEVWRPAIVATVGVRFLPGFKNAEGS